MAHLVSWVFNPIFYCTAYLAAMTVAHPQWWPATLQLWFWLAWVPGLLLLAGVRRGWWSDLDVSVLTERRHFMPWVVVASAAALAVTWGAGFPALLRLSSGAIFVWLALSTLIGRYWKISLHVGGAVGILWLTTIAFGAVGGALLVWVPWLVGWARLRLHRHTLGQVVAGAAVGTLSVAVVWQAMGFSPWR